MVFWKVAKYTALTIGALVLIGVAISVVATILGIAWAILTAIATLLVIVGLTYATIQGVRWLRSDGDGTTDFTSVGTGPRAAETEFTDPVEALTDRYVSGELTEDEFERQLSLELDGPEDEIDRELQRSLTK